MVWSSYFLYPWTIDITCISTWCISDNFLLISLNFSWDLSRPFQMYFSSVFVLTSRRRDANGKNLRCINMKALKDLLEAKMASRDTYGKNLRRLTSFHLLLRYTCPWVTTHEVTSFWFWFWIICVIGLNWWSYFLLVKVWMSSRSWLRGRHFGRFLSV